ncbi:phosphoribosylaminoimidazolecarboxamide formyltransferase, IMP cyclohydrolase and MGS-like domain [Candidatus Blochmanniella floridana]|uniref:Bifunctional purine biosynthesis protein PurH n=1 Tax=Blochmanniella floridana TaxID=203907 RepID=Q7VRP9_BLOFL|nr:phosphoribosylaminoimidazolecarboxamide formyltransferase, IMP cyclohydrolase and MGS-like domain [Candidatus Blochmannia floridanus]
MSSSLSIRQALISVFDKSNLLHFSKSLSHLGIKLLSTEGTALILTNAGLTVNKISDYTNFPEIMNGQVKTLHHKICAGILSRKNLDESIIHKYGIQPIDMVIVNFYPFHLILQNKQHDSEKILEYIDIGGPNMVRAAAKNYKNTVIIVDNNDYDNILNEINTLHGSISLNTRLNLAAKAFKYIKQYDTMISDYFQHQLKLQPNKPHHTIQKRIQPFNHSQLPEHIQCVNLTFKKKQTMRYGENPHQYSVLYTETNAPTENGSVATSQQLQGKTLSYNNIIDMDTALECVKMFDQPTCVIVKHSNPCGVATADNIFTAYNKAYQADPTSAFGGIIAFNYPINNKKLAQSIINQNFVEAIIAPYVHQDCLNILSQKKNIRVLQSGMWNKNTLKSISNIDFKRIPEGLLIQEHDTHTIDHTKSFQVVTNKQPTIQETQDALFCWKIVKFVKSNAIVCGKDQQTTGIGTGQTNRILAVKIATSLRLQNTVHISGSSMASDAFFPFPDSIKEAASMGISCIIQPGGSIQDPEIIKIANQHKISMIFTKIRHFRH